MWDDAESNNYPDDVSLARRVAAGDEAALEQFYANYADLLFAFVYHHLDGARQEAEELWQSTLLAALRSISTYRGQSSLFTWLCGIARHKIADHYRRQKQPIEVFADMSEVEVASLMGTEPLPEECVMRRATRIRVVKALAMLSSDYQAALVARYVDERGVEEISHMLGRTYKAAESLLSRARIAFRDALAQLEEEDER